MPDETLNDWQLTVKVLLDDVLRAAEATDRNNDGCARRNYVRAVFAAIEGITYGMKRVVLHLWKHRQSNLNADELELLAEIKIDGQGKNKKRFLRFEENIKFVFEVFAKVHGLTPLANYNSKGWAALLVSAEVRNRLMHPKSSKDLDVSDDELDKIKEAANWYFPTRNQLFERATNEFKKEYLAKKSLIKPYKI